MNVAPWLAMYAGRGPARVTPSEAVSTMTVADVLAAVDAGELTVAEAIAAEQAGRARVTLLSALRER